MNFWEQFALYQATAALHTVIRLFGAKYFTPEELAATDIVVDALASLPARIHNQPPKV